MKHNDCLYFNLNAFARQFNKICEDAFESVSEGVSVAHGMLLMVVLERPGLLLKEISEELCLASSTVTRFVDALEARDLVRRQVAKQDGRAFSLYPTQKAETLAQSLCEAKESMDRALLRFFSQDQIKDLNETMAHKKNVLSG